MNLVDEIVLQHSEFEAPLDFWRWAALCTISAVIKDNVWINRHIYKLYPNIYVMLHADSGLKKGPPVNYAAKLYSKIYKNGLINGRSSIQGILKEMGTAHSEPGGKINGSSTAFICSSEMSSSIVSDPVAATILTDLYDRHYRTNDYKSLLKMETFSIKDPCITMFSATNEAHTDSFFEKKDFQGGFFARTFIVVANKRNKVNSLIRKPKYIPNEEQTLNYLKELTKLRGEFRPFDSLIEDDYYCCKDTEDGEVQWLSKAGKLYHDWYKDFTQQIDEQEIKDETGTLNRFGDSVLKVALLLSLSEKSVLEITENSVIEAIKICEKLVGNIRKTSLGKKGISSTSILKALIINELLNRENHQVTRTVLMKKFWMHYSTITEFDDLMVSFDSAGMIKNQPVGNNLVYYMTSDMVEEMRRFMEGKVK